MKSLFRVLLPCLMIAVAMLSPAHAQTSVAGTWQGRLEPAPGTTLTIQFVITAAPGGGYTALVTSPDSGAIRNVPAKSVKFADNRLTIDVPKLSGGYSGTLRNGTFEGAWTQEGAKLPLTLRHLTTAAPTAAEIEVLKGEWSGQFKGQGLQVTLIFRFSAGADGALRGELDIPEQVVKGMEATNVVLDDGHVSLKLPKASVEIKGQLKGNEITAQWMQFGTTTPITLKKGKYIAVPRYLDIPAAARDQVKGSWGGTLGPLKLIARFETDAQGRMVGFFDSPDQKALNIPITEATLAGTKFTFGIAGAGAKYTGELAGDKLTGEWSQLGLPKPVPLSLTRQK